MSTPLNIYQKKFTTLPLTGVYAQCMGTPESTGAWIVYGAEKNGKTWFSLALAVYLSQFGKALYVSAEEGTGLAFVENCRRAGVQHNTPMRFLEYLPLDELSQKLQGRKAPKIVFIDNCTIYADELKAATIQQLLRQHPDKLFVFIAHEEKGKPYTAPAKLIRKLAKIICRVEGLVAHISGRCPGGTITIHPEQAALYWGADYAAAGLPSAQQTNP